MVTKKKLYYGIRRELSLINVTDGRNRSMGLNGFGKNFSPRMINTGKFEGNDDRMHPEVFSSDPEGLECAFWRQSDGTEFYALFR